MGIEVTTAGWGDGEHEGSIGARVAGREQRASLVACFNWCNRHWPYQALGQKTLDEYFGQQKAALLAI